LFSFSRDRFKTKQRSCVWKGWSGSSVRFSVVVVIFFVVIYLMVWSLLKRERCPIDSMYIFTFRDISPLKNLQQWWWWIIRRSRTSTSSVVLASSIIGDSNENKTHFVGVLSPCVSSS
jgi:hypothetical protein